MNAEQIYERLKQIAPNVCFTVTREVDEFAVWDGDPAKDPAKRGMICYDVDITAAAIFLGEAYEETASLGLCYYHEDEEIGDIGGFLPQKLNGAAKELFRTLPKEADSLLSQLADVKSMLQIEIQQRYQEQKSCT